MELYSHARSNLKKGINEAKASYRRRIEGHFSEGDSRRIWQGIKYLTNMKGPKDLTSSTSSNLAEEINYFFYNRSRDQAHISTIYTQPDTHCE